MTGRLRDAIRRLAAAARRLARGGPGRSLPQATRRVLVPVLAVVVAAPFLVSPSDDPTDAQTDMQVAVAGDDHQIEPAGDPALNQETPAAPPLHTPGQQPLAQQPAARPPVADEVEPVQPDLLVRPKKLDPNVIFEALAVDGVRHLAGARDLHVTVEGPKGPAKLRILVVDPIAFRPLTPDATAKARAVWERLLDGEMVVRHDIAQQYQLPLGGNVGVVGPRGDRMSLRIGAFASNGTPPLAAALVPWEVGTRLGAGQPNMLVIAVDEDDKRDSIGSRVVEMLGGGDLTELDPPQEQRARLVGAGSHVFEPFSYLDHGDGMITIDSSWVQRNIVTFRLPIFGGIARCHRIMAPQLVAALEQVQREGLAGYIDTNDYGGCWVPRHILFDPSKPLSMHAWGLAVDFNVQTNQYGARPTMHPRIVEIFESWGFEWGGRWGTPDGMHFELRAVIK